jgi:hypothetical protein
MSGGINPVWKASKRGGARLAKNDIHIGTLLQVALGSGDSENPFQELGLGEKMIFDLLDLSTFAPIQDRVKEIFEDFEDNELAALDDTGTNLQIIETRQAEAGMQIDYVNLETGRKSSLVVAGSSNGLIVSSRA